MAMDRTLNDGGLVEEAPTKEIKLLHGQDKRDSPPAERSSRKQIALSRSNMHGTQDTRGFSPTAASGRQDESPARPDQEYNDLSPIRNASPVVGGAAVTTESPAVKWKGRDSVWFVKYIA